jgi:dihydroxy-acid dehydratase
MAMGCLNRPSIVICGGTMKKGKGTLGSCAGRVIDIGNALEYNSELISGKINEEERRDIIRNACPGAGACGGM